MKSITFTDTEGRQVELLRPFFSLDFYQIRIDGVCVGNISRMGKERWEGTSVILDSSDLDELVWIVEQHEGNRKK